MVAIGTTLFTGSLDNTVRRWSLKEQDLLTPPPKDIVEPLSGSGSSSDATVTKVESTENPSSKGAEAPASNLMTEEEERELAELMESDIEDD